MANDKERSPGLSSAEIEKYLDLLAKDPNSRVFAPLAEAYRKAGFLDDAVEIALEGLKVHPNYLGGRVALGRAYFEKKQYAEAAAEMQKVAKAAPDNIIAHKVIGQIAYSQSDLPTAEKAFKMVLLLDPRDQEAQQFIANLAGAPAQAAPVPPPAPVSRPAPEVVVPRPAPQPPPPQPQAAAEIKPAAPVQPSPPAPALPAFDEIQGIDLDLQADDIFGAPEPRTPAALPFAMEPLAALEVEEPLDISESEPWLPKPAPAAAMELEVFSRVAWGGEREPEAESTPAAPPSPPAPAAPLPVPPSPLPPYSSLPTPAPRAPLEVTEVAAPPEIAVPGPAAGAHDESSPFEIFGRPKRGGPPPSTKGEQGAFGEIDLESTAYEAAHLEPEPDSGSPFEIFTREPDRRSAAAAARAERGPDAEPREMDIETTAYALSDSVSPAGGEVPLMSLDEELPRIDLTQEIDFGPLDEPSPTPAAWEPEVGAAIEPELEAELELEPEAQTQPDLGPGIAPELEPQLEVELEPELEPQLEVELEPALEAELEPMDLEVDLAAELERGEFVLPDQGEELSLHDEIPSIDLVAETPGGTFGEEEFASEEEPAAPAAERGVFDTETLASIYINQGFYGRAAEIYQRLITQRPDDAGLRAKLEGVLALERAEAGPEAHGASAESAEPPSPAVAAAAQGQPAAATPAASEVLVSRLQTLLETFKGGRPR